MDLFVETLHRPPDVGLKLCLHLLTVRHRDTRAMNEEPSLLKLGPLPLLPVVSSDYLTLFLLKLPYLHMR